jgi:hypothetical protein
VKKIGTPHRLRPAVTSCHRPEEWSAKDCHADDGALSMSVSLSPKVVLLLTSAIASCTRRRESRQGGVVEAARAGSEFSGPARCMSESALAKKLVAQYLAVAKSAHRKRRTVVPRGAEQERGGRGRSM